MKASTIKALLFILAAMLLCMTMLLTSCDDGDDSGGSLPNEKDGCHIDMSGFYAKYLSEDEYNGGDFRDESLSDSPDFSDGKNVYLVVDFSYTMLKDIGDGRSIALETTFPGRGVLDITIEEAPTSGVEEIESTEGTSLSARFSLWEKVGESKSVRVVFRMMPVSGGEVPFSLALTVGDDVKIYGASNLNQTINTGEPRIIYGINRDGKSYSVINVNKSVYTAIIPNKLKDGLPVTAIASEAFKNATNLESLTIGSNITSIGASAFSGCTGLKEIRLFDIGKWCGIDFENAESSPFSYARELYVNERLTRDLSIPEDVEAIGDYAFFGCDGLTSVIIHDGVLNIGKAAFGECTGITDISVPFVGAAKAATDESSSHFGYIFGAETADENGTHVPSGIKNVTISGQGAIGDKAFNYCGGIQTVTIGDGISSIGASAFKSCAGLTAIVIPNSISLIGESAFSGCIRLSSLIIGSGITEIKASSFEGCRGLTEIDIPEGIGSIEMNAFADCSGLTNIHLPESLTAIGEGAFYRCSALTEITIPRGVISLGDAVFESCTGLESIAVSDGNAAYKSIDGNLYTADGCRLILYAAGKSAQSFTVPDGVTAIGNYAFAGCKTLKSINIPTGVTSIGNWAFARMAIASISIPGNVKSIGDYAFYYCSTITEISIPDSVTDIGKNAFDGCMGLTRITFGGGITSIGDYAFWNCPAIEEVHIESLESWCAVYFSESSSNPLFYAHNLYLDGALITDLVIPDTVTSIGKNAFYGCSGLKSVTFGASVKSIGNAAFRDCTSLTSITADGNITRIGSSAFRGCESLKSVTLGDAVSSVGSFTFKDCTALESVIIGKGVASFDGYAFEDCSSLTDVYYTGSEAEWSEISIGNGNSELTEATMHYDYVRENSSDG